MIAYLKSSTVNLRNLMVQLIIMVVNVTVYIFNCHMLN